MPLLRVPIYPTRNLATEIDPGARTIVAGTNVTFNVNADGSITINAAGGGTGTVTSVGATGSTGLTVGGSPITTSGTLTFTLSANLQSWSGIAPASKANDSAVVHLAGSETITGIKTFSVDQVFGGTIFLRQAAGTDRTIIWGTGTSARWAMYTNSTSESGSNAGSNFALNRYNDAGSFLGLALSINRATGQAAFETRPTFAGNLAWDAGNFTPGNYVLKSGDTMTGTLTLSASYGLRFSGSAGGRLRILDDTGSPSLQWTNAAESVFSIGRYVATEHRFIGGPLDSYGGTRIYNAGQLKIYDTNNDTPLEIGVGYGSGSDRNAFIWNRNNGFLSFGVNNTERARLSPTTFYTESINMEVRNGDIYTYRAGGTTGVIFLNSSGTKYLYNDGSQYVLPVQSLNVNAGGITAAGTINSTTQAVTGLSGTQGWQIVWNTVQSGQGRTEFVNNRGGGSGGFTWWDRANTGAGTGTALAALTGAGLFVNGVVQFATGSTSVGQLAAWAGNANYIALTNTGMTGTEYMMLSAHPSIDTSTYISSAAGGNVNIRPSANSVTGQVQFSTSSVTSAVPIIDNTGYNVRRIAPVVINATQNLSSAELNRVVEKSNVSSYTYTIPSGLGAHGDCITILNGNNSGTITIARGAGVQLVRNGLDANITVNPGNMVTIMRTSSADRWQA